CLTTCTRNQHRLFVWIACAIVQILASNHFFQLFTTKRPANLTTMSHPVQSGICLASREIIRRLAVLQVLHTNGLIKPHRAYLGGKEAECVASANSLRLELIARRDHLRSSSLSRLQDGHKVSDINLTDLVEEYE